MTLELVIIFGIISICLGILPAFLIIIHKFGLKKRLWFSWFLGGAFWGLALLARMPILILLQLNIEDFTSIVFLSASLAGIFETLFRVVLLCLFTKFVANSKEKLFMVGLGWGMMEAICLHTIPVLQIMIAPNNELLQQLQGNEWTLVFGGIERILAEIFHLALIILVFYGVKDKLRNIEKSEPIANIFFTRDPKPVWLWVIIVAFLHFSFDYMLVSLTYSIGIIFTYLAGFVFVGIIVSYITHRVKAYPLFLKKNKN